VVGRAAGEHDDAAQVADLLVRHAEALEHEVSVANAVAERLLDRVGLVVDLLQHEGLVAGFLGHLVVPVDVDDLARELVAVDVDEAGALGRDRDDLAVVDQLDLPRLLQERRRAGGEEHLPLADADEERALLPRAHEQVRVVVMDDNEREVALELLVHGAYGLDEVSLVAALDQMDDHLGVGLRVEGVTVGAERAL
jgi:hypothetical protein